MLPSAEMKNKIPARIKDLFRPKRVARIPERALPMIQPISALLLVNPCMASVYWKSPALLKKAWRPFSAPEITAVS